MAYSLPEKVKAHFEQAGLPDITFIGSKIFVQDIEVGTLEGYVTRDRLNRMISDFKRDHHG
jgi:hypothetical protein